MIAKGEARARRRARAQGLGFSLALAALLATGASLAGAARAQDAAAGKDGEGRAQDASAAGRADSTLDAGTSTNEQGAPAVPEAATSGDPLQLYLRALSDSTSSSFRDPVLQSLSISDAAVDSLLRVYEETGVSPAAPSPTSWKLELGVAGARYNRVEGLNVIPRATLRAPLARPTSIDGRAGYGWSAREFTAGVSARAQLARRGGRPTLQASWARDVYAYGSGIAGGNSLTALMLGKDYGDYFRGEGWSAGIGVTPGELGFDVSVRAERQESLPNAAAFNVFEGDHAFRPNPRIDDGSLRIAELAVRWADRPGAPWSARANLGAAGRGLGGDFEYETARADATMRRRVWFGDRIVANLAGGWVGGGAPFQALHHLGGFQSLRGYGVNEFPARTFGHLSADYEVGSDPLRWVPWLRKLRIQPVAFADGAAIFERQARDGSAIRGGDPDWRFSTGVGLQKDLLGIPGGAGQIRFDAARRLDRGEDDMTYRARITLSR